MKKEFIENYLGWDIYLKQMSNGQNQIVAYKDDDEYRGASSNGKLILKFVELPYFKQQMKENVDELKVLVWEKLNGN